ncbi:mucin-5AC [Toxorhynchites rutilus septentrionalis]|uniref:mucin-5AC n=1 Tax=Toxorhynchites rutilus septentrionalis TaxID=329112 RepID=UPI00247AD062|nr:mucin-5AC [Toxorhynchites rutilus septentrionalis]
MNRAASEDSAVEMTVESISSAASDIGSVSDSPVRKQQQQKKKRRSLSFKKIRNNAQKLMAGRKRAEKADQLEEEDQSGDGSLPSPPPTPELQDMKSTESLPAIKEEQLVLQSIKSADEILRMKKVRKPSRAAGFVRKLAGRKTKVAPNPSKVSTEDEISGSTIETPLSIKRRTPEGANLSVSETSLYEGEKPKDTFKIEQLESEPKMVRTIAPKTTEMKLTLIDNKHAVGGFGPGSSKASSGVQLPESESASVVPSSSSSSSPSPSSSSGVATAGPSSVTSVTVSKSVASDSAVPIDSKPIRDTAHPSELLAVVNKDNIANPGADTKANLTRSPLSGDYIAEIDKISIDKISTVIGKQPTAREQFFQPLAEAETNNALETFEVNDNVVKAQVPSPESTAADKLKNFFMKKEAQKKSTNPESSSNSPSTKVRTQEAPPRPSSYQLGNNIKNPNLSGFKQPNEQQAPTGSDDKPSTSGLGEPKVEQRDAIVFNIGSQVRPDRTTTIKPQQTLIGPLPVTENITPSGNFNQTRSLEDFGSRSDTRGSPDDPQLGESSRRRIAYVAQPTLFATEEEEIVFAKPSQMASVPTEESADYLESKMSPHGELYLEKADSASNMSTTPVEKREYLYKILVIGELGTGKTSFIKRYVHQFFSQNYRATIGVDFALKVLNWDQNTIIRLQLWDIAGQERFGNMTRVYYKEAVGAFIVFDVTRSATFDAVIKWKQDLDSKVQLPNGKPIPCILLANKSDQRKQGIVTTPEKVDEYVKEHGFAGWFETSAKENKNIEEAANSLVNKILTNEKQTDAGEFTDVDRIALVGGKEENHPKKNCPC